MLCSISAASQSIKQTEFGGTSARILQFNLESKWKNSNLERMKYMLKIIKSS